MKPKIYDLAVAAGIEWIDMSHQWVADDEDIERFAELVRQDEREAVIDIVARHGGSVEIEAAVRQRGEK